ncbi:iron-containing alcohol dehydrogenase [Clostridium beijerinckii]|jgi:Alcohol dehydrogenase, class IV|uniref:Iron-containing alcohol dehydrogenase n=2 Tax=Clostridium beijerinckii TaxID=1520 RepID=A0AAE2RP16_CLOBE|nr:iron-containing alcohol dehydrogenase [Clostridium beijerinckii]ABR36464.1 iron-containing alcohol dehydrogenase [Clostridium beijerinckii NCIMB 8052]AIU02689.1 iron-containing alcohol dehydrogenase [Clostridium beijerinckii ATCC 35702]MBF7808888.1 iron-containing alcohol dehydrogenase [Clostridium beijerinckii]NRT22469.1 alcohol dehydrogenase class IV [Clostridium beijerinckii]NRT65016.1 alcohol dehydrogenase class IV [Clostridium beijerinckii]
MNFNYNLPINLLFGRGRSNEIGTEVAKYGKKALIVTGRNSTKKSGLLDKTIDLLNEAKVQYEIFDKVEQNPLTTTVYEGVDVIKETGCDVVLGLGGGSIMDAAKSIAFSAKNPGDISEYIFGIKQGSEALPIVLVPTTCGTGSEGNCFSVLTNPETKDKKSLRTNIIIAKASIIDPELMVTMSKSILSSVGFDALAHNMEAYLSKIGQPLTDMKAFYGIKLLSENLVKVYNDPSDLDAWDSVTLASTLGGMVIGIAGVTAPHGLEHPASGLHDIVHGKGLAALTPIIVEKSWESNLEKYSNISKLLGGTDAADCADAIRSFLKKIGLKVTLGELGIEEKDVEWMAENCIKVSKPSIANHPKEFSLEEIKDIYYKSL